MVILKNERNIRDFLQTFMDLVHILHINFLKLESYKEFGNIINERGFNSLTELTIQNCIRDMLNKWQNPFKNLESLMFSSNSSDSVYFNNTNFTFNKLFPNVKNLELRVMRAKDWEIFSEEFEHAKSVEIDYYIPYWDVLKSNSTNFFIKNSQIETLKMNSVYLSVLNDVSRLTNLKSLEFERLDARYDNFKGNLVHFKTVKNFKITTTSGWTMHNGIPNGIVFDNLEELIVYSDGELNDNWIGFIEKQLNSKLSRLELHFSDILPGKFEAISDKLPELEHVIINNRYWQHRTTFDSIEKFMRKSNQLKTLDLIIGMNKTELNKTIENLKKANWNVEVSPSNNRDHTIRLKINR